MVRYLETKPPDLGPRCVLFETFGRCPYGVTCRFAGAHLGPEGQNLVLEELLARGAHMPPLRNALDKTLQRQLRKRQVRFERAEQALRGLSQGPVQAAAVAELTAPEGDSGQNHCTALQDPAELGAGSPVQTCGPLTDEDTVRLRPCEKKRVRVSGALWRTDGAIHIPAHRLCPALFTAQASSLLCGLSPPRFWSGEAEKSRLIVLGSQGGTDDNVGHFLKEWTQQQGL